MGTVEEGLLRRRTAYIYEDLGHSGKIIVLFGMGVWEKKNED